MKEAMKKLKDTFINAYGRYDESNAHDLGAALAYFTVFSLIPLISIVIIIAGIFLGKDLIVNQIFAAVKSSVGSDAATLLKNGIETASRSDSNLVASIISVGVLIVGVFGITTQLQGSLDRILCKEVRKVPFLRALREKFASFGIVFLLSVLLMAFLIASSAVSFFTGIVQSYIPLSAVYIKIFNFILDLIFIFAFCVINFRFLPNIPLKWRSVFFGSLVTSILFVIGKFALSIYLTYSDPGSGFGAAGALLVMLLWIYYSAQILFFGASFAYACEHPRAKH